MTVLGIILTILGVGGCIYGIMQNNSMDAQLSSLFSSGRTNPGTIFIVIGIAFAVVGIVLLFKGLSKKQ